MNTTDQHLIDAMNQAYPLEQHGPGINQIVTGGRRRARRRRGVVAVAAAASLAVLGGTGYALTQPGEKESGTRIQVASPVATGCTRAPATCDPAVVRAWAQKTGYRGAGKLRLTPIEETEGLFPDDTYEVRYLDKRRGHLSVELLIVDDQGEAPLWRLDDPKVQKQMGGADLEWTTREVRVGDTGVTAKAFSTPNSGSNYEAWTVPAGQDHGALAFILEGTKDAQWNDTTAIALLKAYLTEPPRGTPAGE